MCKRCAFGKHFICLSSSSVNVNFQDKALVLSKKWCGFILVNIFSMYFITEMLLPSNFNRKFLVQQQSFMKRLVIPDITAQAFK